MPEIRRLDPHDPLPEGHGKHLVVLRRFQEDEPGRTVVEIVGERGGMGAHPSIHPDGRPMDLEEAVEAASRMAEARGLKLVYVIDRAAGPRERDILQHHGDHSVHMDGLDDFDLEDGERGPDMRDRHG
jgi:hypothetical protein